MKKTSVFIALIFTLICILPAISCAASLSSSMKATFQCLTSSNADIKVSNVTLQVKNSSGGWESAGSLTAPPVEKNSIMLSESKDYSSSCTKGKTYRISATFTAHGNSTSCYSNERKY